MKNNLNSSNYTLEGLYQLCKKSLTEAGIDQPALEASIIIEHILNYSRMDIILSPEKIISQKDQQTCLAMVEKRVSTHIPIAYLTKVKEFYGRNFHVDKGVLIPRPDSEILIDAILDWQKENKFKKLTALDLGTGSGCLILTLAMELDILEGVAIDISEEALNIAQKNLHNFKLDNKIQLLQSNWDQQLDANKKFDLIISNPPYISSDEIATLSREVKDHEPYLALDGDEDGLSPYYILPQIIQKRLNPQGKAYVEIGYSQAYQVTQIFEQAGLTFLEKYCDLSGHDRILCFTL